MAMTVTEECIACFACQDECPNDSISPGDIFTIDGEKCTECVGWYEEPQCVKACPVDCIIPDPLRPETRDELLEKYERNVAVGVPGAKR